MNYQHEAAVEWMSASTNSTATKMEVIEEEEDDEKKRSSSGVIMEREHMFDKVVTPSDVGKLNRLVIPKQHAEKYFPLDSSNNDKGLLLNFEDGTGKPWRFRYSYWNSSQSYVMTKGWSRFVKEKKLDAGDIVSFQRGVGGGEFGKDKLFIDWRRRPDPHHHGYPHAHALLPHFQYHHPSSHGRAPAPPPPPPPPSTFAVLRSHPYTQPGVYPYPQPGGLVRRPGMGVGSGYYGYGYGNVVNPYPVSGSLIFLRSSSAAATPTTSTIQGEEEQNVYESVPVVQGKATAKRLRLFGVNMECTPISHPSHDFDILSPSIGSSSSSSSSSSIPNNHPHPHHHHHHQQHTTAISMGVGPPTSTTITATPSLPLQLRSFFNGTSSVPSEKGKSSTSSSSMSLDLDI